MSLKSIYSELESRAKKIKIEIPLSLLMEASNLVNEAQILLNKNEITPQEFKLIKQILNHQLREHIFT